MSLNILFQSKVFRGILYGIGIAVVLIAVFAAGVYMGYRKAEFSYRWGERYLENFTGPPREGWRQFGPQGMMNPNGVFGRVIKVDASSLVVQGQDNVEKIVSVTADTEIRRFQDRINLADLKPDDNIVVIGSPDDKGEVQARLIRVMPGDLPPMPMMYPQAQNTQTTLPQTQQ